MSVIRSFTLSCDRCKTEYNSHMWKGVLLADAESDGWEVGKEDVCPSCKAISMQKAKDTAAEWTDNTQEMIHSV